MPLPRFVVLFASFIALCTAAVAQEWESLFDGKSLAGWKASENPGSPRVEDGAIVCEGKRAHLFYMGADGQAEFENFELELEVKTEPGANSGVYFLTKWQDKGWPDAGFEAQVNNKQPPFKEYDYRENKKTASLYGIRNLYKPMAVDGEWFTMNVKVARPRVQIRLNGRLVSDYIEPANPTLPSPGKLNLLGKGTFALQCHDEDSRARYRNIRVRRLPSGEDASVTKPTYSEQDLRRLALGKDNFPIVNLRVRLDAEFTLKKVEELRSRTGIFPGIIVNTPVLPPDEKTIRAIISTLEKEPVFTGLNLDAVGLRQMKDFFTPETIQRFDYIVGQPFAVAISNMQTEHEQGAMDREVDEVVRMIETAPIDICAGAMLVRAGFHSSAEALWTEERMQRVISAAVKHGVAFEIDLRQRTPSEKFIKLAKAAKVKFTFGSDVITAENYGDWSYALEMQKAAGLGWKDIWVPGHKPTRAQRELQGK